MFGITEINDEMYGNDWKIGMNTPNGFVSLDGRPTQYDGVHGLVSHNDEYYLLAEDDGYFSHRVILTKDEINTLHSYLTKLLTKFTFKENYKVTFDTHTVLDRKINEEMSLTIEPRNNQAPIISLLIKGVKIDFDVNWLPALINVLDLDNPIKE